MKCFWVLFKGIKEETICPGLCLLSVQVDDCLKQQHTPFSEHPPLFCHLSLTSPTFYCIYEFVPTRTRFKKLLTFKRKQIPSPVGSFTRLLVAVPMITDWKSSVVLRDDSLRSLSGQTRLQPWKQLDWAERDTGPRRRKESDNVSRKQISPRQLSRRGPK